MERPRKEKEAQEPLHQGVLEVDVGKGPANGDFETERGDQRVDQQDRHRDAEGDDDQPDRVREAEPAMVDVAEDPPPA